MKTWQTRLLSSDFTSLISPQRQPLPVAVFFFWDRHGCRWESVLCTLGHVRTVHTCPFFTIYICHLHKPAWHYSRQCCGVLLLKMNVHVHLSFCLSWALVITHVWHGWCPFFLRGVEESLFVLLSTHWNGPARGPGKFPLFRALRSLCIRLNDTMPCFALCLSWFILLAYALIHSLGACFAPRVVFFPFNADCFLYGAERQRASKAVQCKKTDTMIGDEGRIEVRCYEAKREHT